jgi:hypothetical protein
LSPVVDERWGARARAMGANARLLGPVSGTSRMTQIGAEPEVVVGIGVLP